MAAQTTNTIWYCGSTKYTAVTAFPLATLVVAGAVYRQLTAPAVNSERCFVVTTAGLTTTEPSWTVTKGALNTSGTAVFQECTGIAGLNGDITNSPSWLVSGTTTPGQVIYVSSNGSLQIATVAGTNGSGSIPAFSATAGVTTSDNTTTWTSLGLASNFAAYAAPFARMTSAAVATWMVSGDTCYVSNNSAETVSQTSLTFNMGGTTTALTKFICVSDTVAPPVTLATTATINNTGGGGTALTLSGNAYCYGIDFNITSGAMSVSNTTGVFENCIFGTSASGANNTKIAAYYGYFLSSTFIFGATAQSLLLNQSAGDSSYTFESCSFATTGSVPTTLFKANSAFSCNLLVRDCDLSQITGQIINTNTFTNIFAQFEYCKLASSPTLQTGTFPTLSDYVKYHCCDSSGTSYRMNSLNVAGTVQQSTSTFRLGGATNGTTPISWQLASATSAQFYAPFQLEELYAVNTFASSTHTATVYITSASTLTNGDVWIEVEYLGSSTSPKGSIVTTRKATQFITNVALTADTSTWTGAQTNLYSISASYSPLLAGVLKVRVYVGTPSLTIYVDPKVVLA